MSLDLTRFASKVNRYCSQFDVDAKQLSASTGISLERIVFFQSGNAEPSGDEILILADFFKCDYKFFISNEKLAPFEQTENLFRQHGDVLTISDRWSIQEFLFLCECEQFLLERLGRSGRNSFSISFSDDYHKGHGKEAAKKLREYLGRGDSEISADIFAEFRKLGFHVFRRKLDQSSISGLCIHHPAAGPCVLVNYSEDIYRQRFTAAHEAAHGLLDRDREYVVSFANWEKGDLVEIRANSFASHFLLPPSLLHSLPNVTPLDAKKLLSLSNALRVNPKVLLIALSEERLIRKEEVELFSAIKIPLESKIDPELPESLSSASRARRVELLKRGLSHFYVNLCFDAYDATIISAGRLAECLLGTHSDLDELCKIYGRTIAHGD